MRPRVFLADDHQILIDALTQLLEPECRIVGSAADGSELLLKAPRHDVEVFVIDIHMPKVNGLDCARALRQSMPKSKIVILTVSHNPTVAAEAMKIGCSGYVLKDEAGDQLVKVIFGAMRGRTYVSPAVDPANHSAEDTNRDSALTPRQAEVLSLLAGGLSMKQVAHALGVTTRTVAHHKYTMMASLGIRSSAELYGYATKIGLKQDEPQL